MIVRGDGILRTDKLESMTQLVELISWT
jgi:hypothetical protein